MVLYATMLVDITITCYISDIMSPTPQKAPTGDLKAKIDATFGSTEELIKQLDEAGSKRFGSGWAWLVVKEDWKFGGYKYSKSR